MSGKGIKQERIQGERQGIRALKDDSVKKEEAREEREK